MLILRGSRFFGPLINIFFSMLQDLAKFMVLYGLVFLIFVFVCMLAMTENENFNNLWSAIKKVFEMSMGQFEFAEFD